MAANLNLLGHSCNTVVTAAIYRPHQAMSAFPGCEDPLATCIYLAGNKSDSDKVKRDR